MKKWLSKIDWLGVVIWVGITAVISTIVIVILAVLAPVWDDMITVTLDETCYNSAIVTQECIDYRFHQCMLTDAYSRQECIELVGSK